MSINRLIKRKAGYKDMDSVQTRQEFVGKEKDISLLQRCNNLWEALRYFRQNRARAIRFAYGDQWGDPIEVNGKKMTQREYLMKQGNVVVQTNQIKNKIATIEGVLIKEHNVPICNARDREEQQYGEIMTTALQANCEANKMEEVYISIMKEFCVGGLAVCHESYDDTSNPIRRMDSWTKYCNPNHIFFDSAMTDPRFWDMSIIGQFFDMSFEDVCANFVKDEKDFSLLKQIYSTQSSIIKAADDNNILDRHNNNTLVFDAPNENDKCRVFEVWTKETKARIRLHDTNTGTEEVINADDNVYRRRIKKENEKRKQMAIESGWGEDEVPYIVGDGYGNGEEERNGFFVDTFWYCRFLAPDGTILWEGESPYADRLHPFTLRATPFVDGKISGYMQDAIDHNIAINRAIILHDWLIRSQAKGVTVVPKQIVPEDMSLDEFAESWTSIDDMVFINMKPGQEGLMPRVFYGSAQTFNVSDLISTYSKLMENSTAVNGALQGKAPLSGTSASLYAQMTNNASTPIASILTQVRNFMIDLHIKKLKNIVSFYSTDRLKKIAGDLNGAFVNLNLDKIADIEFDLAIKEGTDTPVYRAIINDDAKEFLMRGIISFEEYLKIANVPYADKLLQERQARAVAEGGQMQGEQVPMQNGQQNGRVANPVAPISPIRPELK